MCIGIYQGVSCLCDCHKTIHCHGCKASAEVKRANDLPIGWTQYGEEDAAGSMASWCPKCTAAARRGTE